MRRADLIKHLERQGCRLLREGGKHSVYYNAATQRTSTIPRHREINNRTAVEICRQLQVPDPLRLG
ncbi:MAG: type II toxin-antitoxin system HicA family toxin [Gemmatimonadaceae bacterium]